jgi:beta-aspartyl-peptidase (threonine type)
MRPADVPPLIGVGADEAASLAVEPNGTGRVYANTPGPGISVVHGGGIGQAKAPGPLTTASVHMTGAGPEPRVRLPYGTAEKPSVERDYRAANRAIAAVPGAGR